jgi:hypothetical protein
VCVQGFDNLYVLTGGLQAFCELHPNYIEGTLPEPKVQPRGSSSSSSNRGTPQRRSSTGSTIAGSVRGRYVQRSPHNHTSLRACSVYTASSAQSVVSCASAVANNNSSRVCVLVKHAHILLTLCSS